MTQESDLLERRDRHILVVDDDNRIRSLLKTYLTRQGYRVSVADNAQSARKLMTSLSFDLLIVDVMMPGESGFQFTQSVRQHSPIFIILLTARGEAEDRIEGLKLGADDYLAKPFEPEELTLRIDALFKRQSLSPTQSIVRFGPYEYDINRMSLQKHGQTVRLTTGEETLLTLLAKGGGAPVSRYALADKIKAKSDRAVDVQMTRLRRKLETHPAEPEYILTVRGQGYRLLIDKPD